MTINPDLKARAIEIHASINALVRANYVLPQEERTEANDQKFLAIYVLHRAVLKGTDVPFKYLKILQEAGIVDEKGSIDNVTRLVLLSQYESYRYEDIIPCLADLDEFDEEAFEAEQARQAISAVQSNQPDPGSP